MARLESQATGGYYPTPAAVAEFIAASLRIRPPPNPKQATARFLDPCCGEGQALEIIAGQNAAAAATGAAVETFGIELNEERARRAALRLDRLLSADLFASSAANGQFSFMLLNPPYDNEARDEDEKAARTELAFLQRCTQYLIPGQGIIAFIVPAPRLKNCARYLAANYFNLRCRAFPQGERERFNQVTVLAQRRNFAMSNPGDERLIRRWALNPPEAEQGAVQPLAVPWSKPGDVLFTSLFFDPANIAAEAAATGLWANPAFRDPLEPPKEERKRPLMPLRKGHVALLTAAGFLDNMVLESGDGPPILVKGRAYKEKELREDTEEKQVWLEVMRTSITAMDLETGEIRQIKT